MPAQKTILIRFPTNSDGSLTHQVRNFGEDIWREIEQAGLGDVGGIETVDRAIDELSVTVSRSSKIGTVKLLVERHLRSHLLDGQSEVTTN